MCVARWTLYSAETRVFQTPFLFLVKMGINQGYFCVLLASLSTTCTSDCPTKTPYSLAQPPYDECTKLHSMLETALLNNSVNLFKLHDILFPRSSSEPNYAMATFHSKVEKCYWYTYNSEKCHHTCWTSSLLLRSVDSSVLTILPFNCSC